ncbi:MAG: hypothetical protein Q8L48_30340 [Archangium sp.]|nr:hypothetical protein [Archangium sp.]
MTGFIVFEGPTDEPLARALMDDAGLAVFLAKSAQGKTKLDAQLAKYAAAAERQPWFILRDLDQDAPCAPAWIEGRPKARWFCLRLAVRETEAWLLADRERFAEFFRVAPTRVPLDPDGLADPKRTLVDLVRHSTSSRLKRDIVPADGAHSQVGPGYVTAIVEFASQHWRLAVAAQRSDSLRRARLALRGLGTRWRAFTSEA